jgi:hypothetical protein
MRFTTIRLPDGPSLMRALAQHVWSSTIARDGIVDLSDALVMVPASRAVRAFEHHLIALAREAGHAFVSPRVVTPAGLASRFVVPTANVLGSIGIQLAWRHAIISAEARVISALSPGGIDAIPGEALEPASIDALAARIATLHRDVTSAYTDFASVAAELRATMPELDLDRWDAMLALEKGWRPVPVRCTRAELLASMCYLLIRNGFSGNYWVRLPPAALLFRCWCTVRMRSCQRHLIMTDFLNTQRGRVLQWWFRKTSSCLQIHLLIRQLRCWTR